MQTMNFQTTKNLEVGDYKLDCDVMSIEKDCMA